MDAVAERVERGAQLLDEKRPGWWQEIDLRRLDIDSPCNCIAGQLGGSTGAGGYLAVIRSLDLTGTEEVRCGFEADDDYDWLADEYAALTDAWRTLILARRAAAQVPA